MTRPPLTEFDITGASVAVDFEPESARELGNARLGSVEIEQYAGAMWLSREDDVLSHGHHRDQHEVLIDHPDSMLECVPRDENASGCPCTRISPSSGR